MKPNGLDLLPSLHPSAFCLFFTAPARTRTRNSTFEASCDRPFHHKGVDSLRTAGAARRCGFSAGVRDSTPFLSKQKTPEPAGLRGSSTREINSPRSPGHGATVVTAQRKTIAAGQQRARRARGAGPAAQTP